MIHLEVKSVRLLNVDTIEEVKIKIEKQFSKIKPEKETIFIHQARGRILSEDLMAGTNMPEFSRSVVDGYGIKASDSFGSSETMPTFFTVVGSVEMGEATNITIHNGEAVYIPTGGMIPDGIDAVVMIEYTETLDQDLITIHQSAAPGDGIMAEGDDFKKGDILLKKGHKITSKDIGVIAALGKVEVMVYQQPMVSIISTGDELVDIDTEPKEGQIRDINAHTLWALCEDSGARINRIIMVADEFQLCKATLQNALAESDIILMSGGSSQGNKDMTVDIINAVGQPGVFVHGIAIKPGKPTIIANVDGKAVFGLPGHPLSAIIVYKAIVDYFIHQYYLEVEEDYQYTVDAVLDSNVHSAEGRETYQMVKLQKNRSDNGYTAVPLYAKSGSVSLLMKAHGYIKITIDQEGLMKGQNVQVILL